MSCTNKEKANSYLLDNGWRPVDDRQEVETLLDEIAKQMVVPKLFGSSFWYYNVITRNLGRFYTRKGMLVCLSDDWRSGRIGINQSVILVRPIAPNLVDLYPLFFSLCKKGFPLVIKQTPRSDALRPIEVPKSYRWSPADRFDDQTYPEVILVFSGAKSTTRDRRFCAEISVNKSGHGVVVASSDYLEMNKTNQEWAANKVNQHGKQYANQLFEWNRRAINALISNSNHLVWRITSKENLVGFLTTNKNGCDQVDLGLVLIKPDYRKYTRPAIQKLSRILALKKIRYINLGGSETKKLYKFKTSIGAYESIDATHYMIESHRGF